jgi:toxin CcdB
MPRYDVYSNPGGGYVLDVQADLLDDLKTRIVIPLIGPNPSQTTQSGLRD